MSPARSRTKRAARRRDTSGPAGEPNGRLLTPGPDSDATIPTIGEIGLTHFVPYLINRISARWNANLQDVLRTYDLTTNKMRILAVLSVMPGLTVNELAVHAVAEQSTMSRTLDVMEAQGLVRRLARPDDMRAREIHITEDGRALFATIWPPMYEMYTHLFDGVDDAELRAFIGTLHKVMRNIRAKDF